MFTTLTAITNIGSGSSLSFEAPYQSKPNEEFAIKRFWNALVCFTLVSFINGFALYHFLYRKGIAPYEKGGDFYNEGVDPMERVKIPLELRPILEHSGKLLGDEMVEPIICSRAASSSRTKTKREGGCEPFS